MMVAAMRPRASMDDVPEVCANLTLEPREANERQGHTRGAP